MTELVIQSVDEHSSYSSYSTTLGASILAAALLSSAVPAPRPGVGLEAAQGAHQEQPYLDHSYSDSVISQSPIDQQLYGALQDLYTNLVATQQDLEPETRKLLYSN